MSLYGEMLEAAAVALHQHGALTYLIDPSAGQTDNWRDCPRADAHEGAGKQVLEAFLAALPPSIVVDGRVVELRVAVGLVSASDEGADRFTSHLLNVARRVSE